MIYYVVTRNVYSNGLLVVTDLMGVFTWRSIGENYIQKRLDDLGDTYTIIKNDKKHPTEISVYDNTKKMLLKVLEYRITEVYGNNTDENSVIYHLN